MMRYVPMDNVVIRDERRFAFWDTVRDRFVEIGGDWSWTSVEDLLASFESLSLLKFMTEYECQLCERLTGLARGNGALEKEPPE